MPSTSRATSHRTFADFVDTCSPAEPELPLVHTTESRWLASIQVAHKIEPRYCKVFKKPLLYMFYGRPAYRDPTKTTPNKDIAFCPVCFVLRPGRTFRIKRIFPFDTGASRKNYYKPQVSKSKALNKYAMKPAIESAQRIIGGIFETNGQYLKGTAKEGLVFLPEDGDAQLFHDLITVGGHPDCDDRKSAVEIQTEESVDLTKDLMAVVLPNSFLEDTTFRETLLNVWRAHPLTYDSDLGMRPTEFHAEVKRLVKEYYRTWNFL